MQKMMLRRRSWEMQAFFAKKIQIVKKFYLRKGNK